MSCKLIIVASFSITLLSDVYFGRPESYWAVKWIELFDSLVLRTVYRTIEAFMFSACGFLDKRYIFKLFTISSKVACSKVVIWGHLFPWWWCSSSSYSSKSELSAPCSFIYGYFVFSRQYIPPFSPTLKTSNISFILVRVLSWTIYLVWDIQYFCYSIIAFLLKHVITEWYVVCFSSCGYFDFICCQLFLYLGSIRVLCSMPLLVVLRESMWLCLEIWVSSACIIRNMLHQSGLAHFSYQFALKILSSNFNLAWLT